jgi:hypothetical protein
MSSFDGDSEVSLKGTYTSPTNNVFTFNVAGHENPYFLGFVNGFSATIANLIPINKQFRAIKMNEEEFNLFKNTVLNQEQDWIFKGITIPGRWRTSTNAGGKRSSCRRRRSICKHRHVQSKRRHRRTKHN